MHVPENSANRKVPTPFSPKTFHQLNYLLVAIKINLINILKLQFTI